MPKIFLLLCFLVTTVHGATSDFWKEQKRGTNFFNEVERQERFKAAEVFGVEFVRLAPNKWKSAGKNAAIGDFLLGDAQSFTEDMKQLKNVLDQAHAQKLKVVLTMLSIPGARWKQHNNNVEERKIWEDFKTQDRAIEFWKKMARELKGHPALVGYNLRNEPSPELTGTKLKDWYTEDYALWYQKIKETPANLNLFYRKMVKAIREIDPEMPIVLDSGFYATPWAFKVLEPIPDDPKILYSFHMYEPFSYNSQFNKGQYTYPGKAPIGEEGKVIIDWNRLELEKFLAPIEEWQKKYSIPSRQIYVGEVGVFRTNKGAAEYLKDILSVLNAKKWHWSFYSFREDTWAGMDYELGTGKPPYRYWQAIEAGKMPDENIYLPNDLSKILKKALKE